MPLMALQLDISSAPPSHARSSEYEVQGSPPSAAPPPLPSESHAIGHSSSMYTIVAPLDDDARNILPEWQFGGPTNRERSHMSFGRNILERCQTDEDPAHIDATTSLGHRRLLPASPDSVNLTAAERIRQAFWGDDLYDPDFHYSPTPAADVESSSVSSESMASTLFGEDQMAETEFNLLRDEARRRSRRYLRGTDHIRSPPPPPPPFARSWSNAMNLESLPPRNATTLRPSSAHQQRSSEDLEEREVDQRASPRIEPIPEQSEPLHIEESHFAQPPSIRDLHTAPSSPPRPAWDSPVMESLQSSAASTSTVKAAIFGSEQCTPVTASSALISIALVPLERPMSRLGTPLLLGQEDVPKTAPCLYLQAGIVFNGRQAFSKLLADKGRARPRKRRASMSQPEPPVPSSSVELMTLAHRGRRYASTTPLHRAEAVSDTLANSRRLPLLSRGLMQPGLHGAMYVRRQYSHTANLPTPLPNETYEVVDVDVKEVRSMLVPEKSSDAWSVQVSLHSVNLERGTVNGMMHALDVRKLGVVEKSARLARVTTVFEGEIIDGSNYGLWTDKWGSNRADDIQQWSSLRAFEGLGEAGVEHGCPREGYVLMRWKERDFVNVDAKSSGLTISGFYHVALHRASGNIEALYYDPTSSPYQRLTLAPSRGFASFTLS